MADALPHTATTQAPKKEGGFPPFDATTFPSQLFWLAVTFAFLFTVLWRVAGPRINGAFITGHRGVINAAIAEAGKAARGDAEAGRRRPPTMFLDRAGLRARARGLLRTLAEETRQTLNAEIAKAKAAAGKPEAHDAMAAEADARIAATRDGGARRIATRRRRATPPSPSSSG